MEVLIKIVMLVICWNIIYPVVAKLFKIKLGNSVFCGMVGFSSDHKAEAGILRTLLLYNLERGEDSTGWAINNEVTKDTVDAKKFLSKNRINLLDTHENFTIIAHARKSSSGYKMSKEHAHPFGMYKDATEKDKYDLILAMNGTLTNTAEMAKHFEVPYAAAGNSDTQILARIMAKLGEKEFIKALEAYDGTATLLFFTPKYPNTLMVYKDPARDLFYWQKSKNEMYVSSMDDSLFAAGAELEDVHPFEDNVLFRITKGRITKETKVIRAPIKKEVKVYNQREDYGYSGHGGGQQGKFRSSSNSTNMDLFRMDLVNTRPTGNVVYCLIDRYFRNGHPLNGSFLLDENGKEQTSGADVTKFKRYYFVNGNLLESEDKYNELKLLCAGLNNDIDLPKFKEIRTSVLCEYYAYPPLGIVDESQKFYLNSQWKKRVNNIGNTISYTMPFSNIVIELIWQGKAIPVEGEKDVLVRVADIKSIKKKEEQAENKTANFEPDVKEIIKAHSSITVGDLSSKILLKWNANNTPLVKEMFFKKLLDLFLKDEILSKDSYDDLTKIGKQCGWNSEDKEFTKEIEYCLQLLKTKEDGGTIAKVTSIISKHVGKEDLNDDAVNEDSNQIDAVIATIEKTNTFYGQKMFRDELYDAEYSDIAEFSKEWSTSFSKLDPDLRTFSEAIIIGLHKVGKISSEDFLKIVEMKDADLHTQAEKKYEEWRNEVKKEDVEEKSVETWSIQDHEDCAIDNYCDIKTRIEEEIKELDSTPEDLRSDKFKLILDFYIGTYAKMVSTKSETE